MIDPHWTLVDLDPHTWRNIGRFFDPGQYIRTAQAREHGLFVLHDNGAVLRVFDTRQGIRRDLPIEHVDDACALARDLFERGEWQRVHVINKRHLAEVARLAQATPQRSLHLDEYYRRVYHLLWDNQGGYVSLPPHPGHWHGWTYSRIQQFMQQFPASATLALAVLENASLKIGLILEVHEGTVKYVTTFEALTALPPLEVSAAALEHLRSSLAKQFAPPVTILLCTQDAFEQWITSEEKSESLKEARQRGAAIWHLEI